MFRYSLWCRWRPLECTHSRFLAAIDVPTPRALVVVAIEAFAFGSVTLTVRAREGGIVTFPGVAIVGRAKIGCIGADGGEGDGSKEGDDELHDELMMMMMEFGGYTGHNESRRGRTQQGRSVKK